MKMNSKEALSSGLWSVSELIQCTYLHMKAKMSCVPEATLTLLPGRFCGARPSML